LTAEAEEKMGANLEAELTSIAHKGLMAVERINLPEGFFGATVWADGHGERRARRTFLARNWSFGEGNPQVFLENREEPGK